MNQINSNKKNDENINNLIDGVDNLKINNENINQSGEIKTKIKKKTNNDIVWENLLLERLKKSEEELKNINYLVITADYIKSSKDYLKNIKFQFEPRLICKMDNNKSRPQIFKDNNLFLLSIENGVYCLINNNIYIKLNQYFTVPNIIKNKSNCLLLDIGNSESSMLDKLLYNKVFDDIIGEEIKFGPLLGGRHRCKFETNIDSINIKINGSQYETDGCYETDNFICIVEAKNNTYEDFNIRQLYYPYREVYKCIKEKKKKKKNNLFIFI